MLTKADDLKTKRNTSVNMYQIRSVSAHRRLLPH